MSSPSSPSGVASNSGAFSGYSSCGRAFVWTGFSCGSAAVVAGVTCVAVLLIAFAMGNKSGKVRGNSRGNSRGGSPSSTEVCTYFTLSMQLHTISVWQSVHFAKVQITFACLFSRRRRAAAGQVSLVKAWQAAQAQTVWYKGKKAASLAERASCLRQKVSTSSLKMKKL
jgi:hypothetical protein